MPESFLTTNDAPPLVAPAITLSDCPLETTYQLIAAFGPIYVASSLPASKDSIADGPALNTNVSNVTLSPNVLRKLPSPYPLCMIYVREVSQS